MTGQQGTPGSGFPAADDQESTQVGMPVPPMPPDAYRQLSPTYPPPPPPPPAPPPPDAYGPPPAYGAPPGYRYPSASPPPARRRGVSPVAIGSIALLLIVGAGIAIMYAAHLGPFAVGPSATLIGQATPTPTLPGATITPAVTPIPTPTPTPLPTSSPTPLPTTGPPTIAPPTVVPPTVGPSGDPDALLRSHVPPAIVDTCTSTIITPPAIASVLCTANDNAIVVSYSLFSDKATMDGVYTAARDVFAIGAGNLSCGISSNWPSEYEYSIDSDIAGRVFCADLGTIPQMYWTDDRFNILSWSLFATTGTRDDMYLFWQQSSGPF